MNSFPIIISILALLVSSLAFYVSFRAFRRSISFINGEHELLVDSGIKNLIFSKFYNKYWIKIWISNRGKEATTIRHVRIHIDKLEKTKLINLCIINLVEITPETDVMTQKLRTKLVPGEMILYSPTHDLFEKLPTGAFKKPTDVHFSLWVRHSQRSQVEVIHLMELKKEILYWEKHARPDVSA